MKETRNAQEEELTVNISTEDRAVNEKQKNKKTKRRKENVCGYEGNGTEH